MSVPKEPSALWRGTYWDAKEPYDPVVWGAGILDVRRALMYAELKNMGKDPEEILKIINFRKISPLRKLIRERTRKKTKERQDREIDYVSISDYTFRNDYSTKLWAGHIDGNYSLYGAETPLSLAKSFGKDKIRALLEEDLEKTMEFFRKIDQGDFSDMTRINYCNNHGHPPLHWAILTGRTQLAKELINKGADINMPNNQRLFPLHLAALRNNLEIADILIQKGADKNSYTTKEHTPLNFARTPEMKAKLFDKNEIIHDNI